MKFLWALLLVTIVAQAALAADDKNTSFVMVNGKKFFLMRNARMFAGSKKPMPANLSKQERRNTMPFVRSAGKPAQASQSVSIPPFNNTSANAVQSNGNPVIKVPAVDAALSTVNSNTVQPGSPAVNNNTPNGKAASDVLSIFEP